MIGQLFDIAVYFSLLENDCQNFAVSGTERGAPMTATRKEHDFLGDLEIPADVYYGIQTSRALENFRISGTTIASMPRFIQAFGYVKKAAALANMELGVLPESIGRYICLACDKVIAGELQRSVSRGRVSGRRGHVVQHERQRGYRQPSPLSSWATERANISTCHPNNHVNMLAVHQRRVSHGHPSGALHHADATSWATWNTCVRALRAKAVEFRDVMKMGRTQMQDAVPMTLGMEFSRVGDHACGEDIRRIGEGREQICDISMGATAIGTGINTPEGYAATGDEAPRGNFLGCRCIMAENLVEATVRLLRLRGRFPGLLKRFVVKHLQDMQRPAPALVRGPAAALNEINLPAPSARAPPSCPAR